MTINNEGRVGDRVFTAVPALPGWTVLYPCWDSDLVCSFEESPVIAWALEITSTLKGDKIFTLADPITVEATSGDFLLRDPNGRLLIPEVIRFDSLNDAKLYFEAERAREQAERVKALARGTH